ncbi:MAG: 2OG-Fe(II) oxygenase [Burkholderiales bacterium]|jgi:predicted 2-oxoglutarate/Fe(II)-dependent dioxygenase YbiX|nr:2OG-Fe(II) oxygenase [Burkholderiales bacterium]
MRPITDELAQWLRTVRNPGDFYAAGVHAMHHPQLQVEGVGPVALPLLPIQAEQLIAAAERAPYGRGPETLVDTDVRRTWQIGAQKVRLEGQHWKRTLDSIVERVAAGLGVSGEVLPELYKLLLYDQGSFFVRHRDSEKAPGMFGTLIVALPSLHSGGELVVRHANREVRLDLKCDDPSEAAYAAFYADCLHEVLPVTTGCRLALVYNLLRKGAGRKPKPPSYAVETAGLVACLQRWSDAKAAARNPGSSDDSSPEKLVYPLEHAYTPAEVSFDALKGEDAAAAAVLATAAQQAGCDLHVALLKIEENGSAEHTGYSGSRRWGRYRDDDDDEDEDEFEIGEIFERNLTLSHWRRPDASAAAFGDFPFTDAEACPTDALLDVEPDEQHFHEATGNEGASFERSYQRAALVLWPRHRRLAVLNQAGLAVTLPALGEFATHWERSGESQDSPLWHEAHELGGHMHRTWPLAARSYGPVEDGDAASMLGLLARLNDTALIESFVTDISADGHYGQADNPALLQALGRLPAARAGALIAAVVTRNAPLALGACADLLARAAQQEDLAGHLHAAGRALLGALPGAPTRPGELAESWRAPKIDAALVVDLMLALWTIDASLAERAASHLLAWPKTWGLDSVIVPALRRLAARVDIRSHGAGHGAVQGLRSACLAHLRSRAAQPLEAPADWSRAAALQCPCARCKELARFLLSPAEPTWRLKAAEHERSHVEATIQQSACDVDCETDRRGRPYTLVCAKNRASYERRVAQRKRDLEDLKRLG